MTNWSGLLEGMTAVVRDTFGEPVLYWRHDTGETLEIEAVFDPSHETSEAGGTVGMVSRVPVIDVSNAAIGREPEQGDAAQVQGNWYSVRSIEPSSSGMSKAILRRRTNAPA